MKKIKQIMENNKVLLVLGAILIICLSTCIVVSLLYFYGSSDNAYGNRLDEVKNVELNKKLFEDIETELMSTTIVKDVEISQKGKIVYINIEYNNDTPMDEAKKNAENILTLFNDDELAVYDIQYTISSGDVGSSTGYTLMGARNVNGIGTVIWNNYNIEESVEENEKE